MIDAPTKIQLRKVESPFLSDKRYVCYDKEHGYGDISYTRTDIAEAEITRLQEQLRWRKYPNEKPAFKGEYFLKVEYSGFVGGRGFMVGHFDGNCFNPYWLPEANVLEWMPIPDTGEGDDNTTV